jgi:hypothetical protein
MCIKSCDFVNEEFPTEIQKLAKKQQVLNYAKYSNFIYTRLANCCFFFSLYFLFLQNSEFERKFPRRNLIPFLAKFHNMSLPNLRKFLRFPIPKPTEFPQKKLARDCSTKLKNLIFPLIKISFLC